MNILIVSPYGLYNNLSFSFVHAQAKGYLSQGSTVRVLILTPFGKSRDNASRFETGLKHQCADGIDLYYLRYLSVSNWGAENGLNSKLAVMALKPKLRDLISDFKPDIIHAHTFGVSCDVGYWLKRELNVPLVVTTHGTDTLKPLQQGRLDYLKNSCNQADAVVTVSSKLKQQLAVCHSLTATYTILDGFKTDSVPSEHIKKVHSMIQAGHLIVQKGNDITIKALRLLHHKYPDFTLTIVGQGSQRESLETLCADSNLTAAVKFTGQLDNRQTLKLMADSQFFCMPSINEGFGIVYLEAMACGCVTIGTAGEGIADLIENGRNGFLVPPHNPQAIADVIEKCLADPNLMNHVIEKGKQDVRELNWPNNARQYIELFSRLISKT